jgi:hypothetical protein
MIYSDSRLLQQQQEKNSLLLVNEEAKMFDFNDKLLLPSSTRSIKRRTSLLEKSRDWVKNNFLSFHNDSILLLLGSTSHHSSSTSSKYNIQRNIQ